MVAYAQNLELNHHYKQLALIVVACSDLSIIQLVERY